MRSDKDAIPIHSMAEDALRVNAQMLWWQWADKWTILLCFNGAKRDAKKQCKTSPTYFISNVYLSHTLQLSIRYRYVLPMMRCAMCSAECMRIDDTIQFTIPSIIWGFIHHVDHKIKNERTIQPANERTKKRSLAYISRYTYLFPIYSIERKSKKYDSYLYPISAVNTIAHRPIEFVVPTLLLFLLSLAPALESASLCVCVLLCRVFTSFLW